MHGAVSSNANPSGVQGVCPTGWHIPSAAEWTQLTDYVSGQNQYRCGNNSSSIAKALAATTGWYKSSVTCAIGCNLSSNNATNFNALPAGYSQYGTSCFYFDCSASFWSATESTSSRAECRSLWNNSDVFILGSSSWDDDTDKAFRHSVRCLRD